MESGQLHGLNSLTSLSSNTTVDSAGGGLTMPEITTPDQSLDDWEALQKYCDEPSDDIVETEDLLKALAELTALNVQLVKTLSLLL